MSYQVLARKWRPKNFSEVVGQEHVVRALTNALIHKRLHHAYLFTGTRGIGKTSLARILAKCLNCESGVTATPCGQCDACTEIDSGRFVDLIEVDAASRTKVEDTRDLLDNVQYLPTRGTYKIYIIDEVHMLSGHSFNALLKTLEEPPEHVKFLLATTDPQKLPVTVLSRCLQFNLKMLTPQLIKNQLEHILIQEKIPYEDNALHELALSANGSIRDSLSLLDQAIAFGNNKISDLDVKNMLGTIDSAKILAITEALINNSAAALLTTIAELAELGTDFSSAIDSILDILHKISLVQMIPEINTRAWQNEELIKKFATTSSPEDIQLYYQIGLIGKRDLYLAPSLRSGFEMVMLRMLAFRPPINVITTPEQKTPPPLQVKDAHKPHTSNHNDLLLKLDVTGPTQALLKHCIIAKHNNNEIELLLDPTQAPLLSEKNKERINQAFNKYYNAQINVTIKLGTNNMATDANLKKQETAKKQHELKQTIEQDNGIQDLINKFDAKIISTTTKNEEI